MYIEFQNIVIRNASADDAETLCRWWNDGKVMAHAGFPKGLGTTVQKIEEALRQDTEDTFRRLILEIGGAEVGELSFRDFGKSCEIGIKICDEAYQNHGYGRIVLSLFIKELFKKYERIFLDTDLENIRAQHVYEALGFKRVKVRYNSWVNQIGVLRSAVDYELLPEHFKPVI